MVVGLGLWSWPGAQALSLPYTLPTLSTLYFTQKALPESQNQTMRPKTYSAQQASKPEAEEPKPTEANILRPLFHGMPGRAAAAGPRYEAADQNFMAEMWD